MVFHPSITWCCSLSKPKRAPGTGAYYFSCPILQLNRNVYSLLALTEDFLLFVLRILLSGTLLKKAVIFTINRLQIA